MYIVWFLNPFIYIMTDQTPAKNNWFQVLTRSMFYTGTIMLLFPLFINVSNPTTVLIITYSLLTLCLGMVTTSMYNRMSLKLSELTDVGVMTYLQYLLKMMGPVLIILGILIYSLYLFIRYRDIINDGNTSKQYYTFSKVSIAFVIIHFILLFNGFSSDYFKEKGALEAIYSSSIYLTGVINAYLVIIMGYILMSYTTDG